jgi:hypothetical protein
MRQHTCNDRFRGHRLPFVMVIAWLALPWPVAAQPSGGAPFATLLPARGAAFPNDADSNSPAVWDLVDGAWTLTVLNSVAGASAVSQGPSVQRLADQGPVAWHGSPPYGGVWFESVVRDTEAWYGFYHNETAGLVCDGVDKVWPRIGAARSEDGGRTWTDLGPILQLPTSAVRCDTANHYFVGGAGDFSVVLDGDRLYAYIYFTQYVEDGDRVGVSIARLAWADRDAPEGRVDVLVDGAWLPPARQTTVVSEGDPDADIPAVSAESWAFPIATPFLPAPNRWDDGRPGVAVFWGPSLHWNTALQTWVMLLNKADSNTWGQEGTYVSYSDRLDDPAAWSAPVRLTTGGRWYPQVIGLDADAGTDSSAGAVARFYMSGQSEALIVFGRR